MNSRPRRWWFIGGITVVLVAAAAITVAVFEVSAPGKTSTDKCAAEQYRKADFDVNMQITAVSPNGEYVVGSDRDPEQFDAIIWHDGDISTVSVPPEHDGTPQAIDVNDSGAVLGTSGISDGAWVFSDGQYRLLEAPEEARNFAVTAMNDEGVIVGSMTVKKNFTTEDVALRWKPGEDAATRLDTGESDNDNVGSLAHAVADDGTVFGEANGETWVWDDHGEGEPLRERLQDANPDQVVSEMSSVIDTTGDWVIADERFNIGDGYRIEPMTSKVSATAIDEQGRVFGYDDKLNAVVVDDKPVILPDLGAPPTPGEDDLPGDVANLANRATGVSRDGSIVYGELGKSSTNVMWTCG